MYGSISPYCFLAHSEISINGSYNQILTQKTIAEHRKQADDTRGPVAKTPCSQRRAGVPSLVRELDLDVTCLN